LTDPGAKGGFFKRLDAPAFVELPTGIFSTDGLWFHTSLADLTEFAAPVLERVPLEKLLRDAAAWVRSPGTFALWAALIALFLRSVPVATLAGVVGFAGWTVLSPGLVFRPMVRLFALLQFPLLVGGAYIAVLSWMAPGAEYTAVAFGLLWFVLIRWGILEKLLDPVLRPVLERIYGLPVPDQVLRGLIIRHALAHRLSIGDLDDMERRMLEIGHRHRNK
jgi:hypothetical protein